MILKHKKINVLGTMSGTSFDGIDISTIITDGIKIYDYVAETRAQEPGGSLSGKLVCFMLLT